MKQQNLNITPTVLYHQSTTSEILLNQNQDLKIYTYFLAMTILLHRQLVWNLETFSMRTLILMHIYLQLYPFIESFNSPNSTNPI